MSGSDGKTLLAPTHWMEDVPTSEFASEQKKGGSNAMTSMGRKNYLSNGLERACENRKSGSDDESKQLGRLIVVEK